MNKTAGDLPGSDHIPSKINYFISILIFTALSVYVFLAVHTNINWDEFNYLSGVYGLLEGRKPPGLNSFHGLLYSWLPQIPGNEIDQIVAARLTQLLLFSIVLFLLFHLAGRFMSRTAALLVVLMIVTYTDIFRHASSFRFDTLSLFFTVTAAYLATSRINLKSAVAAGTALGISFLVTIKTVFFLPVVLGLATQPHRLEISTGNRLKHLTSIGVIALAAFAVGYITQGLVFGGGESSAEKPDAIVERLARIGAAMFLAEGFFPRASYLSRGMTQNPAHWLLIGSGILVSVYHIVLGTEWRRKFATIFLLLLPLLSVVVYRNAFPYFYVYIMPPAMIFTGIALDAGLRQITRLPNISTTHVIVLPILACLITAALYLVMDYPRKGTHGQRIIIDAVHQMFPEAVPYIDAHGLIPSFPKQGFFMSTLGMQRYHNRGEPIFPEIFQDSQPVFLIANHPALIRDSTAVIQDDNTYLLDEDYEILRNTFLPLWGPILVAGKQFVLEEGQLSRRFELLVEGPYRLQSEHPVFINSRKLLPEETVHLDRGLHEISAFRAGDVKLRRKIPGEIPDSDPPEDWLYARL